MEILCAPVGVTHELRRMNLYGVLGRYIPAFGRVVGRMQYDLFHAYTVDAHTLFVVSNLRRLAMPKFNNEFPALSQIMQSLPRQEIAYLAALFHDIAKGRGGDHSELGAVDAEAFCLEQGLGRYEARLVAWLVSNHLILSITSQKKDISDPDIIHEFARRVGDQAHLDYLYVLTVADVRGTNPKLWNAWKARLFEEFYERTKRALRRGLETPVDQEELIRETQEQARANMPAGRRGARSPQVWAQWTEAYFLRYHARGDRLAHQRCSRSGIRDDDAPLVAIRQLADRGGTAVLTYTPRRLRSFARTTAVLDQMGLNVVDARLITSANGFSLETYVVLEDNGAVIADSRAIREIEQGLWRNLQQPEDSPATVTRRAPRQVRMFSTPDPGQFQRRQPQRPHHSRAGGRGPPGTLSEVGKVFRTERVAINGAKIMTVGERAEDVFYITECRRPPAAGRGVPAACRTRWCGRSTGATGPEAELPITHERNACLTRIASSRRGAFESRAEHHAAERRPRSCARRSRAALGLLDAGTLRVAEKHDGAWRVNEWLKKAVLLSFRIADNVAAQAPAP